jgi:hypothetical protein
MRPAVSAEARTGNGYTTPMNFIFNYNAAPGPRTYGSDVEQNAAKGGPISW